MAYTVGNRSFNSYQQAQEYAKRLGAGTDAIRSDAPRVDVIDRESHQFVAQNIQEHEAQELQRNSPSYIRAPTGSYNEETLKTLSYTPDQPKPPSQSQFVEDVQTGKNVPYRESSQAYFESNVQRAVSEGQITPSIARELRTSFYTPPAQKTESTKQPQVSEQQRFIESASPVVQDYLFNKQKIAQQTGRTPEQLAEQTQEYILGKQVVREQIAAETGLTREQYVNTLAEATIAKQKESKTLLGKIKPYIEITPYSLIKSGLEPIQESVAESALAKAAQYSLREGISSIKSFREKQLQPVLSEVEKINPAAAQGLSVMSLTPEIVLGGGYEISKDPLGASVSYGIGYTGGAAFAGAKRGVLALGASPKLVYSIESGAGGLYAVSKYQEISKIKEPAEFGGAITKTAIELAGFGEGYKDATLFPKTEAKPYFYQRKVYEPTESGEKVLVGRKINYDIIRQKKDYDTTKLIGYEQTSKVEQGKGSPIKYGKESFEIITQRKTYVIPRKPKELIPLRVKEEEIGLVSTIKAGKEEYPVFVKKDYGTGVGVVKNPFMTEPKEIALKVRVFEQQPVIEQRVGSKKQKLEAFEPKTNKDIIYITRPYTQKIGDTGAPPKRVVSTSRIEGTPIALPKRSKIPESKSFKGEGQKTESGSSADVQRRLLFQRQKQSTRQKPVLDIKEIKPERRGVLGLTSKFSIATKKGVQTTATKIISKQKQKAYPSLDIGIKQRQEKITSPQSVISPKQRVTPKQRQETIQIPTQQFKPYQEYRPEIKSERIQEPKLTPKLSFRLIEEQKLKVPTIVSPRIKTPNVPLAPKPPRLPSFSFSTGNYKSSFGKGYKPSKRTYRGTPSLSVVSLGKRAFGIKLTKKQKQGRAFINPYQIRKV